MNLLKASEQRSALMGMIPMTAHSIESTETENIYMQYLKLLITYDNTSRFPKLQKHSKLVAPELAFLSNL